MYQSFPFYGQITSIVWKTFCLSSHPLLDICSVFTFGLISYEALNIHAQVFVQTCVFNSFDVTTFTPITVSATITSIITCTLAAPPPPLLWLPPPWPCHYLYRLWNTLTSTSFITAPSPVISTAPVTTAAAALASPSTTSPVPSLSPHSCHLCCFPLLPRRGNAGEFVLITLAHCQVIPPVIPEVWWALLRSETSDDRLIMLSKCLQFFSFSPSFRTSSRDTQMLREVILRTNSSNTFMP